MAGKKKLVLGIIGALATVLITAAIMIFTVSPKQESYTYELGEEVSRETSDYLTGMKWAHGLWKFDFSEVDEEKAGTYTVTAIRWNQTVTYEIIIEDTTAPALTVKGAPLYVKAEADITAEGLIDNFEDADKDAKVGFVSGASKVETIRMDELGEQTITLCAYDTSGNETEVEVSVIVDTAPEFTGLQNIYLTCGSEVDYMEHVSAVDTVDGDVSADIVLNAESVDADTAGEYELTYQVSDSYGLTEEQTVAVYVMEQADLQEAINTHEIDRRKDKIIGAINLYDGGYYEEDNVDAVLEELAPSRVQIRDDSIGHGSGFIITMNKEEIILCTNQHVVSRKETWDVYFYDGSKVKGTVIGTDKEDDVGFVRVNAADVPAETYAQLETVHINKEYWDGLANTEEVNVCFRSINNEGGVWRDRTGVMKQKLIETGMLPKFPQTDGMLWTSLEQFSGSSGSAILDGHGNLIGMVAATVVFHDGRGTYHVGVNLQDILDDYEEIVGKSAYYE